VEINLTDQRPATLPAARVPVAHESIVGRSYVWAPPGPVAKVRPLVPDLTCGDGISGSIDRTTAGIGVAVNGQFMAVASGVPPRGRPV
jgi:hypothetical protein